MFTTIVIFIIVLSILIFAHELGHFMTARKFGVKAEEFGFGFPPRFGGIYKTTAGKWRFVFGNKDVQDAADTVYSINWLPLGGFVKIKGEQGDNKQDVDSFSNQKIWKRIVILTAGVVMNLVIAAVFLSIGFIIGLPQALDGVDVNAKISERNIQVMQVMDNSPAKEAGLQMGDVVVSVNGQKFGSYNELQLFTADKEGVELAYLIKRGDEELNLNITPHILENTDGADLPVVLENTNEVGLPAVASAKAGIGIAIAETGIISYPWYQAIWEGIKATVLMTWFILVAFVALIKGLILGQGVGAEIAGPIGIAVFTGQVARLGFVYILQFTALLSINLAIINYLPFPALDGGRVLFLLIEKVRGKAAPEKVEAIVHNTGFVLLMILVLVVTYRDIVKFFS